MAQEIVQIKTMGDALRNTGYKNIECAMSEIIDNSVQAEASNIFVIISDSLNEHTGRKNITEIGFLDDGTGMTTSELGGCLGIGVTTRADRKGMGRFGVGLPQASLYACPHIEVYSWQNGYINCKKVVLDINKVKSGEQSVIESPKRARIPQKYESYLVYKVKVGDSYERIDFQEKGTLVLWKQCDRVVPKTVRSLFDRVKFALGQKFRYFIYEDGCRIRLIHNENQDLSIDVLPNDPLMLLEENCVLGNIKDPGKIRYGNGGNFITPVFKPFADSGHPDGRIEVPIEYIDHVDGSTKKSTIEVRFSIVKNEFYDRTAITGNAGTTLLGKHVKKLEGISVVRANREIDFGQFDFYENVNQPEHRWWGCEIRFNPELDEAFGVANNKQHVELRKVDTSDFEDDEVKPVWLQIYSIIHNTIEKMYRTNKKTRKGARSAKEATGATETIINHAEEADTDPVKGVSDTNRETLTEEEIMEGKRKDLQDRGVENPSDDDVRTYMHNKVNIKHVNYGPRSPLFDWSFALGSCDVTLNMDHLFYKQFLTGVFEAGPDSKTAFELFICSLARAIDETDLNQQEQNEKLMSEWDVKLRKYIQEQNNFAKS